MKKATEIELPEEAEERNITEQRHELMKRNRRTRTPELVWEQLLNSVGLGMFQVVNSANAEDEEGEGREEDERSVQGDNEEEAEGAQVIRCRQM